MERLASLCVVLVFISVCRTSAQKDITVVVDDGRVGIGLITGGTFGPGSFSIGGSGSGRPGQTHVYVNEDGDGEHVIIQKQTNHKGQQDNQPPQHGSADSIHSGGNTLHSVRPFTHTNPGQSVGHNGGSGGGQIFINSVFMPNNINNKGNNRRNYNKQPVATDGSTIKTIFASSSLNNGIPSKENSFSSNGDLGSIHIGAITGGHFGQGAMSLSHNRRPGSDVPQKGSAVNNGNTGHPNAGDEAVYSIGHGRNNPAGNAGDGYNHGQVKSSYNSESNGERWIWS